MVEIIKGRYGYKAEDDTVQIAEPGTKLTLDTEEEKRLVKIGCAVVVEEIKEEHEVAEVEPEVPDQAEAPSAPELKPRKRKGRKS